MKRHLIRTLSLAAVFALLMTAMSAVFMFASAKDVDNTLIFNSSNAENITEYSDAQTSYLAYRLSSDSKSVTFRRNLALRWFSPSEGDAINKKKNYFSCAGGYNIKVRCKKTKCFTAAHKCIIIYVNARYDMTNKTRRCFSWLLTHRSSDV